MTEGPLDESKYGKLLWLRFSGLFPARSESKAFKNVKVATFLAATIMIFAVGIYALFDLGLTISGLVIGITGLLLGAVCAYITLLEIQGKELKRGELDFLAHSFDTDFYEKGILCREPCEYYPGKIKRGFFHFKNMSKVYLKIDKDDVKTIWDLLVASNRKYCAVSGEEYDEKDAVFNKEAGEYVESCIWFVNNNGELSDLSIDRGLVEDIDRLESLLRRNVGAVE